MSKRGFARLKEVDPEAFAEACRRGGRAAQQGAGHKLTLEDCQRGAKASHAAMAARKPSAAERTIPLPFPPEFLR